MLTLPKSQHYPDQMSLEINTNVPENGNSKQKCDSGGFSIFFQSAEHVHLKIKYVRNLDDTEKNPVKS